MHSLNYTHISKGANAIITKDRNFGKGTGPPPALGVASPMVLVTCCITVINIIYRLKLFCILLKYIVK